MPPTDARRSACRFFDLAYGSPRASCGRGRRALWSPGKPRGKTRAGLLPSRVLRSPLSDNRDYLTLPSPPPSSTSARREPAVVGFTEQVYSANLRVAWCFLNRPCRDQRGQALQGALSRPSGLSARRAGSWAVVWWSA